jgi:uncharacterized repeat protein (TIGR01451 family)
VVGELAQGETIVCTATYTTTAADVEAGSVFNQACATSDQTPEVCDEVDVPLAELEIVKEASVDYFTAAGQEIVYTVTATNVGEATLTEVDISDALIDGLDSWECVPEIPATLTSGQFITCTATYTTTEADVTAGVVHNQACVSSQEAPQDCDDVDVPLAELEIVKSASVDYFTAAGEEIVYTVTATNVGEITLTDVDISDELIDGLDSWACVPAIPATLAVGASIICEATYVTSAADVDAGSVDNVACVASDQTEETCDEVDVPLAELEIVKEASAATYSAAGEEIVYTITATNVGEATLTDVDISDELIDGLDSWVCQPVIPATLTSGQSITCSATYITTAADVEAGQVDNVACVASDQTEETCDDVTVNLIEITIEKTAGSTFIDTSGDAVTFTLEIFHEVPEPPVYLEALTDDIYGDLLDGGNPNVTANSCVGLAGQLLEPDVVYECSFTGPVTATQDDPHVNTATVEVCDSQQVEPEARIAALVVRCATDSDDATVGLVTPNPTEEPSVKPTESLKPTDMLPATDTSAGSDSDPFGGAMSWAVWVLLSALLIVGSGWVIRRQRFAEAKNR